MYSSYLRYVFHSPDEYSNFIFKSCGSVTFLQELYPFQALAFSGESGASIAYPLSAILRIPLICVRKKGVRRPHAEFPVEYPKTPVIKTYAMVDDCISSGQTFRRIQQQITSTLKAECKLILLKDIRSGAIFKGFDPDDIPVFKIPLDVRTKQRLLKAQKDVAFIVRSLKDLVTKKTIG